MKFVIWLLAMCPFMRINLTQSALVAVMVLGIGFTGGTALVAASPQEQHEQDYSKNKNYQQGMRDGRNDAAHNRDHSKKSDLTGDFCTR